MAVYPESFTATPPTASDPALRDTVDHGGGEPIRLLKIARIKSHLNGSEAMIVVRQLSAHFARFDAYLPLMIGESVEIDFDDTGALRGIITERMINSFAMQFIDGCDPLARIRQAEEEATPQAKRRPRVTVGVAVTLHSKCGTYKASLVDLSVGGAKIESEQPLPPLYEIQIRGWDRAPITARVAWQTSTQIGVIFVRKLSISELLTWSA
jgi:hypothetical protein